MTDSQREGRELERLDACIQLAALGAYADGSLAEEERHLLRECIAIHAESEEHAQIMMAFANRLPDVMPPLSPELRAARIKQIMSALPTEADRMRAFELTVDVTNAQQGIGIRESRLLFDTVATLGIDEQRAWEIIRSATAERRALLAQHALNSSKSTLRSASDTMDSSSDTLPPDSPILAPDTLRTAPPTLRN